MNFLNKVKSFLVGSNEFVPYFWLHNDAGVISKTNPLPTDAIVTVDSMSLEAEMKVDSGHDLYEATTVARTADLAVSFDTVTGLTLAKIQSVENKTKGWIYSTKGATVTTTGITLVAGNQKTGYPVIASGDEVEVIYRGTSRLTDKTQMTQITDGTNQVGVIATINSAKSDLSSVAGTATNVNGGNRDAGTQTVTLADNDPLTLAQAIPTTIGEGTKDVTTAGTAEALGASIACKTVYIRAKATNTDAVYIGGSGVSSADGIELFANDSVELKISNIATVFVDSIVNGEGVGFTYVA
jgi:hypothetical protein